MERPREIDSSKLKNGYGLRAAHVVEGKVVEEGVIYRIIAEINETSGKLLRIQDIGGHEQLVSELDVLDGTFGCIRFTEVVPQAEMQEISNRPLATHLREASRSGMPTAKLA